MLWYVAELGLVSIGVAASLGPELIAQLAPAVEDAGFHALWVNDTPGADSLAVLEAAAGTTSRLTLATGVIPVDRRPTGRDRGSDRRAPTAAGPARPGHRLGRRDDGRPRSRPRLRRRTSRGDSQRRSSSVRSARRCGGSRSTPPTACCSRWLTPDAARRQSARGSSAASDAHVALYVRTALDPATHRRLHVEKHRYASIPSYAANFARQRAHVDETVLDAGSHPIADQLGRYRAAVDEVVLRAITPDGQPGGLHRLRQRREGAPLRPVTPPR